MAWRALESGPPGPVAVSVYVVLAEGRTTTLRRGPTSRIAPVVPSVIEYRVAFPLQDKMEDSPCKISGGVAMKPLTEVGPLTRATIRAVSEAGVKPALLYTTSVYRVVAAGRTTSESLTSTSVG